MKEDLKILTQAFIKPPPTLVRVSSQGFVVEEETLTSLRGTIVSWNLVRKRFVHGQIHCSSKDGLKGSHGKPCENCIATDCSPRIRISMKLASHHQEPHNPSRVVLELNYSSSRNFIHYAQKLPFNRIEIDQALSILTVSDRGKWGEVSFKLDPHHTEKMSQHTETTKK